MWSLKQAMKELLSVLKMVLFVFMALRMSWQGEMIEFPGGVYGLALKSGT